MHITARAASIVKRCKFSLFFLKHVLYAPRTVLLRSCLPDQRLLSQWQQTLQSVLSCPLPPSCLQSQGNQSRWQYLQRIHTFTHACTHAHTKYLNNCNKFDQHGRWQQQRVYTRDGSLREADMASDPFKLQTSHTRAQRDASNAVPQDSGRTVTHTHRGTLLSALTGPAC